MPPPPPPPPPGPGPPGPPPPPTLGTPRGALPDRKGLLGDIAKGKQLKKAVTNDRSAPQVGGGVVSNNHGASGLGRPPVVPNNRATGPTRQTDNQSSSAPQLGGLFAGGMPTLRKTSRANANSGTNSEETSTSTIKDRAPSMTAVYNTAPGPNRLPPKAPLTRPSVAAEPLSNAPPLGIPPPPPVPPALPTSHVPPVPPPPPPMPGARVVNEPKAVVPPVQVPTRPAPSERAAIHKVAEHSNDRTAQRLPSLPTAPPPPLPSGVSPAPPLPRAPAPMSASVTQGSSSSQIETAPVIATSLIIQTPLRPTSNASALDGLQAALADRGNNRASHSSLEIVPNGESTFKQTAENGFDSSAYSLKAQRVKRIDDSRYKFQPDNALPIIRPFTNCHKHYRSGRPQGSTVPLNMAELQ